MTFIRFHCMINQKEWWITQRDAAVTCTRGGCLNQTQQNLLVPEGSGQDRNFVKIRGFRMFWPKGLPQSQAWGPTVSSSGRVQTEICIQSHTLACLWTLDIVIYWLLLVSQKSARTIQAFIPDTWTARENMSQCWKTHLDHSTDTTVHWLLWTCSFTLSSNWRQSEHSGTKLLSQKSELSQQMTHLWFYAAARQPQMICCGFGRAEVRSCSDVSEHK